MATRLFRFDPSSGPRAGSPVFDKCGAKLGTVRALIPARKGQHPRYVVVSEDGMIGIGHDFAPVPAGAVFPHDKGWMVGCSRDDLSLAPHFHDGDRPGEDFWIEVDRHFGLEPPPEPDETMVAAIPR